MELFSKSAGKKIGDTLLKNKHTVAVAESVSAGLLQLAFAGMENATMFFQGGMTAYNLAQKARHLAVEPIYAEDVNCVSSQVAEQMSIQICSQFLSDWGLSLTGFATPGPESDYKTFAYYSIAYQGQIMDSGRLLPKETETLDIQLEYTNKLLQKFISILTKQSSTQKSSSRTSKRGS